MKLGIGGMLESGPILLGLRLLLVIGALDSSSRRLTRRRTGEAFNALYGHTSRYHQHRLIPFSYSGRLVSSA